MALVMRAVVDQGAAETTTIAVATPGMRHKILGFQLAPASSGTRSYRFAGSVSGNLTGAITIQSGGLPTVPPSPIPYCETGVNEALQLITTGAGFKGIVIYVTEP
jgi:hypothetical protein